MGRIPHHLGDGLAVVSCDGVAVVLQVADEAVDLGEEVVLVIQEDLAPHTVVQGGDTGHVPEGACGEALVTGGGLTTDVGGGEDVGQLGGAGDDGVVLLGGDLGDAAEAQGEEVVGDVGHRGLGLLGVGGDDHGCALVEIGLGGFVAPAFSARHGVAAYEGEAVLLRELLALGADGSLDAAAVHDDGTAADMGGDLPQDLEGGAGVEGDEDQVADVGVLVSESSVHGSLSQGGAHGVFVDIPSQDGIVGIFMNGSGQGGSDEAQADDSDGHFGGTPFWVAMGFRRLQNVQIWVYR